MLRRRRLMLAAGVVGAVALLVSGVLLLVSGSGDGSGWILLSLGAVLASVVALAIFMPDRDD